MEVLKLVMLELHFNLVSIHFSVKNLNIIFSVSVSLLYVLWMPFVTGASFCDRISTFFKIKKCQLKRFRLFKGFSLSIYLAASWTASLGNSAEDPKIYKIYLFVLLFLHLYFFLLIFFFFLSNKIKSKVVTDQ